MFLSPHSPQPVVKTSWCQGPSSYPAQVYVSCICGRSSLPSLLYISKGTHPSSISWIHSALPQATSYAQPHTPKCLAPTCSSATIPLDTRGPQSTGSYGQTDSYLWLNGRAGQLGPTTTQAKKKKKSLNSRASFVKFRPASHPCLLTWQHCHSCNV